MNGAEFLPGCYAVIKDFNTTNDGQTLVFPIHAKIACEACPLGTTITEKGGTTATARENVKKQITETLRANCKSPQRK